MPNPTITTIIFDWGGVLIDDPAPLLTSIFSRTLGVSPDALVNAFKHHAEPFQKGLCPESEFWHNVCADLNVPPPALPSLWGSTFRQIYIPKTQVWSLARSLHDAGYKTAILSNTELPGVEFFHSSQPHSFNAQIFSCCEHCRKPERRIYDIAMEKLHSRPEESLFIDDNEHYLQGARDAGLHALRFTCPRALINDLRAMGISPVASV